MISIIVPAFNAEKTISSTIEALLNQNYSKEEYEVIVVDDCSTDETLKVASKFPVKLIGLKRNQGPAVARNVGAQRAKGDIILFTDSDCIPHEDWIKNMVKAFSDPNVMGVSGTYETLNKDKLMARFAGFEIEERHAEMARQKEIDFIGTFSAGYRKDAFLQFNGFDPAFRTSSGEDSDLSFRMAQDGLKMVFQPEAKVFHKHPDNLRRYLRQKYRNAVWRNRLYWSRHKNKILVTDSYTPKTLFPQLFTSGLISLSLIILIFFGYSPLSLLSLISVSLLIIATIFNVNLIKFLWSKERKIALLSPFILSLRNVSAIFGILEGLVRYAFKKL